MQTFLPYPDFRKSAECLDRARLGKQRVEAKQIIDILEKYDKGEDISKLPWGNHPAVRMWIGYTTLLKLYYNEIVMEWIARDYKNNMKLYDFTDREMVYQIGIEPNRIDIMMGISSSEFPAAWANRKRSTYGGIPICIIGREDLIQSKIAANRPQDVIDVENLKRI